MQSPQWLERSDICCVNTNTRLFHNISINSDHRKKDKQFRSKRIFTRFVQKGFFLLSLDIYTFVSRPNLGFFIGFAILSKYRTKLRYLGWCGRGCCSYSVEFFSLEVVKKVTSILFFFLVSKFYEILHSWHPCNEFGPVELFIFFIPNGNSYDLHIKKVFSHNFSLIKLTKFAYVTAASQAPCAVNQATLDTSFRQKCLRLRCHDFSALAD